MTLTLNDDDPCATAVALRQVYAQIVAGQAAQTVNFQGGPNGAQQQVIYHKADAQALMRLIRDYEDRCAASQGKRVRRYATRAGGMIR
ncbi:MAG: hypothetical protein LC676_10720 [Loktanella sp.]|nr:hypothetical protein [Loktanella sp.]